MSEWKPIETAPETGESIIGYNKDWQTVQQVEWCKVDCCWIYTEELLAQLDSEADPTHWMPLPAPPST